MFVLWKKDDSDKGTVMDNSDDDCETDVNVVF